MVRIAGQQHPQHFAWLSFVVLLHIVLIYAFINGLASHRSFDAPTPPLQVRLAEKAKPRLKELPAPTPTLTQAPILGIYRPPVLDPWQPPVGLNGPSSIPDGPPKGPLLTEGSGNTGTDDLVPTQTGTSAQRDCANAASFASSIEYPARARRLGLQKGQVSVEFTVAAGGALEIDGITASNPVFESAAVAAVKKLHCSAGRYRLPISFVMQE